MNYRFDYIRDNVFKWKKDVLEDITVSMVTNAMPFGVMMPWIMPDECTPTTDYYGVDIEDIDDWMHQRAEYIKNLVAEIRRDIDSSRADVSKRI